MHILLFILIFIIAIFVFGLSHCRISVKNNFRDRTPFVIVTSREEPDKANKATIKGRTILMMMKRKFCPRILRQEKAQKNIHPR